MPLPKRGTPAEKKEIKFFQSSTLAQRRERAEQLGYTSDQSYIEQMRRRGIYCPKNNVVPPIKVTVTAKDEPEPTIILPKVILKKYKPTTSISASDAETAVLLLTDHHNGEVTISYNGEVYKFRLDKLFTAVLRITQLHRNMYPLDDLRIFLGGDMVHGENAHQGAKVGTIIMGAREQISSSLFLLSEFILSLKQEFKTVELDCVPGNHGRYSREAPATSNWDMILYDELKLKLERYDIKVNIADSFYKMVDIQGKRFFLFHGDQFKGSQGVPWFALVRGINAWWMTHGGFDYSVCGHFHKDDFLRINSKCKLIMGASMATDDPFTEEIIKTSAIPCQWFWGVHKQKGVTWNYSLITDDKYFNTRI